MIQESDVLVISEAQLRAFGTGKLNTFVPDAAQRLRQNFPEEAARYADKDLEGLVHTAFVEGKQYEVVMESDVERLAECMLIYGTDFGKSKDTSWARHILRRDDLSSREKMDGIANYEAFNLDATE